jgi:hypothetical protein
MKKFTLLFWFGLSLIFTPVSAYGLEKAVLKNWPEAGGLIDSALFKVSAEEQKTFTAAFAVSGGPDGLRLGKSGPAIYCALTDQPLELHWSKVPSGAGPENLALGYGEVTLRYAGEELVLERYRGEFKNGFREGWGELLAREPQGGNAFIYRGDFRQGSMEGRGVYLSADFHEGGEAPFIYEGEFKGDTFHGQGVMTDLSTGRVIHVGLWLEGFPFQGNQAKWAKVDRMIYNKVEPESRLAGRSGTAGSAGGQK